ncbi:uncharacterized protein FFC1_03787 [Fusarium fujikuroi]
MQTAR